MIEVITQPTQTKTDPEYLAPINYGCKACYYPCTCHDDIHSGIKYCPVCGVPVCPVCGSADVVAISRVTGYLSDISGWGAGKRQELKDRQRYSLTDGMEKETRLINRSR
jgi:hypothetical protein